MNGIYLTLLLREIQDDIKGQYIDDISIKGRLVQITFPKQSLYLSLYPEITALCLDRRDDRGYDSLVSFSTWLRGQRIGYLKQDSLKPVLRIGFNKNDARGLDSVELTIVLYREAPNLIITKDSTCRKLYARIVEKATKQPLWELSEERANELFMGEREQIERTILKTFEGVDQNLVKELTPARVQYLQDIIRGDKLTKPRLVAMKPLRISLFADQYIKKYDSFNVLLQDVMHMHAEMLRRDQAAAEKKKAIRNLQRRIDRLKKKGVNPEDIERYRAMGNSILANLALLKKGDEHAVFDALSGQEKYEITLDPSKSPQENAQAYFERYKKLKRGQPLLQKKITSLQQELARIQKETWELRGITAEKKKKGMSGAIPFRRFRLDSGANIYVGKDARSNDQLTFSFANPHDYFFHVRGYQGSHVILRTEVKRGQKVPKKDLETAAAIAAYFSKAKKQKRVPVSYTQRKYLKKARKGPPGAVILMREEVMFVDPMLPLLNSKS